MQGVFKEAPCSPGRSCEGLGKWARKGRKASWGPQADPLGSPKGPDPKERTQLSVPHTVNGPGAGGVMDQEK